MSPSDWIPDWVWPRLTGKTEEEPGDLCYFDGHQAAFLPAVEVSLQNIVEQGEERLRTVERKLIARLTLAAVLGAAVATSLVAVAVLDQVRDSWLTVVAALVVIILVFYILAQIVCSLMAALRGMVRRGYKGLTPKGITPLADETTDQYRIRLLNYQAQNIIWNNWVVNGKVSDMAVAHEALKNALWATIPLLCVTAVFAVLQVLCG